MLLGGQEADAVPDDEEMGPPHLPNQPQPAAVVDEHPPAPPSVAAPVVSDAELTDWDAVMNPSQGFNDEIKSGEPEGSSTAAHAQGPPSGGSRAGPGGDGQLRQTAATPAAPNPQGKASAHKKKRDDNTKKWDIFLSYRVSADQDLVKELYWQLCHRTVVAGGKERKLRVFWDRECLKTGEKWEAGFADAICSCHLVVLVMSRTTFVMPLGSRWKNVGVGKPEGGRELSNAKLEAALASKTMFFADEWEEFGIADLREDDFIKSNVSYFKPLAGSHDVRKLAENSRCDNVLLEYNLALELNKNKLNSTAIMPLFVGDKDDSGQYTHFFESGCMPKLEQDVVVHQISEKVEGYLEHNAGVPREKMPKRQSVTAVMDSVQEFQGHFVQGNAYDAVKGAAQGIYECAVRQVAEHRARRALKHFKFSTPQGEQVYEWLADNRLLQFASIFAKNRLDSLRKVSRLTHEEVVAINKELYALQQRDSSREEGAVDQQHGTRVALGDAIERLKGDPSTKTIQEQMEGYNDSQVSVLNLLGAKNQSAAWLGKRLWVFVWCSFFGFGTCWFLQSCMDLMRELDYTTKHRSVVRYGVQLSNDTHTWRYVSCADNQASSCVFERTLASDADMIASNFFPYEEESRYVKILPRLWSGLNNVEIQARGGDMRLGILGGDAGGLDYRILSDGPTGKAWLHYGCSLNRSSGMDMQMQKEDQWSFLDEPIGEVQCCLNASRVHVCTRDGCLSGDHDTAKYTWHDAKAMCEKRGWRLCRREELIRPGSAGCCGGNIDKCGYDEQFVWTSNVGGLLKSDNHGRIGSDTAIEDAIQVTVDLGMVKVVRGVQVQGGVPEIPYHGQTCIWSNAYFTFNYAYAWFTCCFFSFFRPSIAGILNTFGSGIVFTLTSTATLLAVSNDPTVPSTFSRNPVCPGSSVSTTTVLDLSTLALLIIPWASAIALSEVMRPNFVILTVIIGGFTIAGLWSWLGGYFSYAVFATACAVMVLPFFRCLQYMSLKSAVKATALDIKKYEQAWKSAWQSWQPSEGTSQMSVDKDLETIKTACMCKKRQIKTERDKAASSGKFSRAESFTFWIRAGGLGRYGRTGKVCQSMSTNADLLFEEATVLNDEFFNFLEMKINIGELCHGPVKRPDRAFQKVARKYYYDPRHLTDLVRCCILLDSITDVRRVLDLVFALSSVFGEEASGTDERNESFREDEETLLGGSSDSNPQRHFTLGSRWKNVGVSKPKGGRELSNDKLAAALTSKTEFSVHEWEEFGITDLREDDYIKSNTSYFKPAAKVFKLCKVKDDFTRDGLGFRFVCLNLEVGWTIESESGDALEFVTVKDFDDKKHVRTHICEVQLLLRSTYELKVGGCHDNFVKARNMLAQ